MAGAARALGAVPVSARVISPAYGLQRARERAGLSRYKLGEVARVCHSSIRAWELGELVLVDGPWARRLARALGVPVVELLPFWSAVRAGLRTNPGAEVEDAFL